MSLNRRQSLMFGAAAMASLHPLRLGARDARPRIVASFSILADMARELAPPDVEVTTLVGPNADAHVYAPSPGDGKRLAQADLVLINGLGFEGWIERMVKVSGYRGTVVAATRDVVPRKVGGSTDPHAWQDLTLARRYVQTLGQAFMARWPEHQAQIDQRRRDYLQRMEQLDTQVRDWLGAIPRAQRRVMTSHDAFGYFGAAYGLDFVAPQGWATHSEPSAAAVARLIRHIKQGGVRAVFIENISDPRLAQRIAQEAGARVGGTLYSDALSLPDGPAPTYLKMMAHNARSLADALRV